MRPRHGDVPRPREGDMMSPSRSGGVPLTDQRRPRDGDQTLENSRELPCGAGCSDSGTDPDSRWSKNAGTPESRALAYRLKHEVGLTSRLVPQLALWFLEDGGTEQELAARIEKAKREGRGLGLLHDWLAKRAQFWRDVLNDGDERLRHEQAKRVHAAAARDAEAPVCGSTIRSVEPLSVGELIGPQSLRWAPSYAPRQAQKEALVQ